MFIEKLIEETLNDAKLAPPSKEKRDLEFEALLDRLTADRERYAQVPSHRLNP